MGKEKTTQENSEQQLPVPQRQLNQPWHMALHPVAAS